MTRAKELGNHNINTNVFFGINTEQIIPKKTKYVFVADFLASEVSGGAELTTQALIEAAPDPSEVSIIHSYSLTTDLLDRYKDKIWILTNFTLVPKESLYHLIQGGFSYSVVEYDFKFCSYRSLNRHKSMTGVECDCCDNEHGQLVLALFSLAKSIHWMSEIQKQTYIDRLPELKDIPNFVQSSTFDMETLKFLEQTRVISDKNGRDDLYAFQGSGSWIKGIEETKKYLADHGYKHLAIPSMPYRQFLTEISKHKHFAFMPLDYDTCPRVVIEAKLLGCETLLNSNVLHANEPWFQTIDSCLAYLQDNGKRFWRELIGSHKSE